MLSQCLMMKMDLKLKKKLPSLTVSHQMKWILQLTSKNGRVSPARSALRARAIKNGWRSGLEESLASDLHSKGVNFEYEQHRLAYQVPTRTAHYTPDFYITTKSGTVIVVESKGRFVTADRQKMLLVKAQHPHLDIRMVFSNPNTKISKQ